MLALFPTLNGTLIVSTPAHFPVFHARWASNTDGEKLRMYIAKSGDLGGEENEKVGEQEAESFAVDLVRLLSRHRSHHRDHGQKSN